jgi:N-ATPase, AtpR subunit
MSATLITAGAFLAAGIVVGAVHAGLLYRAVMLFAGTPRLPATAAINVVRFGFVIAAFWLIAQHDATALIAAAIGFTLAVIGARFVVERG